MSNETLGVSDPFLTDLRVIWVCKLEWNDRMIRTLDRADGGWSFVEEDRDGDGYTASCRWIDQALVRSVSDRAGHHSDVI